MQIDQLTREGPLKSYLKEVIDRIALGYEIELIEEEIEHELGTADAGEPEDDKENPSKGHGEEDLAGEKT